jgi:hypothetical protein
MSDQTGRLFTDVLTTDSVDGDRDRRSSGKSNKRDRRKRKRVRRASSEQCAYTLWICRWPQRGNPRVPGAAAILRDCRANVKLISGSNAHKQETSLRGPDKLGPAGPATLECALAGTFTSGPAQAGPVPITPTLAACPALESVWPEIWPATHNHEVWNTTPDGTL